MQLQPSLSLTSEPGLQRTAAPPLCPTARAPGQNPDRSVQAADLLDHWMWRETGFDSPQESPRGKAGHDSVFFLAGRTGRLLRVDLRRWTGPAVSVQLLSYEQTGLLWPSKIPELSAPLAHLAPGRFAIKRPSLRRPPRLFGEDSPNCRLNLLTPHPGLGPTPPAPAGGRWSPGAGAVLGPLSL